LKMREVKPLPLVSGTSLHAFFYDSDAGYCRAILKCTLKVPKDTVALRNPGDEGSALLRVPGTADSSLRSE
jgi:hypothetical protein